MCVWAHNRNISTEGFSAYVRGNSKSRHCANMRSIVMEVRGFSAYTVHYNCLKMVVIYIFIAPEKGQTTSLQKHSFSNTFIICCKFFPVNDFVKFYPFKRIGDLALK